MSDTEQKEIQENGIYIKLNENHANPTKCKVFYNPVMQIARELVLCAASVFADSWETPIKCLDAFGATGIGGMQWKHHIKDKTAVTINEKDPVAVSQIKQNCELNKMTLTPPSESSGSEENNSPTDVVPKLEVINNDANVILHQRQFHFIHLDPYGTTVQFLDAAFKNIYHKGVMVITATDVAALYGKQPHVTMRNYGAKMMVMDYFREMAARLLLMAAAKSAAKANKGFDVLYAVGVEHFLQVAVKIRRGATHADSNMKKIREILHCQMCGQWALCPNTKAPIEDPYLLLPCSCKKENPGKTAVQLGPLWAGGIFNEEYIKQMQSAAKKMELSEKIHSLLDILHQEACCSTVPYIPANQSKEEDSVLTKNNPSANEMPSENQPANHTQATDKSSANEVSSENKSANQMDTTDNKICATVKESLDSVSSNISNKRAYDGEMKGQCVTKKPRLCDSELETETPHFYYHLHKKKISAVNLPKAPQLVKLLQREGYRASRTHFEPKAIRTDASLQRLKQLLCTHCKQKPTQSMT